MKQFVTSLTATGNSRAISDHIALPKTLHWRGDNVFSDFMLLVAKASNKFSYLYNTFNPKKNILLKFAYKMVNSLPA